MRLPSIKSLSAITSYPRELRRVLELNSRDSAIALITSPKPFKRSSFSPFKVTFECHLEYGYYVSLHAMKMSMADELCNTCGVEYIPQGHNAKSLAIEYLNAGDTYANTLLWVNGNYRVGCWGDIVERGDYD